MRNSPTATQIITVFMVLLTEFCPADSTFAVVLDLSSGLFDLSGLSGGSVPSNVNYKI